MLSQARAGNPGNRTFCPPGRRHVQAINESTGELHEYPLVARF
jgi:hypothetical protein